MVLEWEPNQKNKKANLFVIVMGDKAICCSTCNIINRITIFYYLDI